MFHILSTIRWQIKILMKLCDYLSFIFIFNDSYFTTYFIWFILYSQFTLRITLLDTAGGTSFDAIQRYAPIWFLETFRITKSGPKCLSVKVKNSKRNSEFDFWIAWMQICIYWTIYSRYLFICCKIKFSFYAIW